MALLVAVLLQLTTIVYPFNCLPELEWGDISGRNIGVVENGAFVTYDVGEDSIRIYRYNNKWENTFWVYHSEQLDEYYLFVWTTEPVFEDGKWAWHTCSHAEISADDYIEIRARVEGLGVGG